MSKMADVAKAQANGADGSNGSDRSGAQPNANGCGAGSTVAVAGNSKGKNLAILLGIVLLVVVAIYLGYQPKTAQVEVADERSNGKIGQKAPSFRGMDLDGKPVEFKAPLDKPTWLVFNATWCSACRAEMPEVKELSARDDMHLMSIYLKESNTQVRPYAEKLGLSYQQIGDATGQISTAFGVNSVPAHVLVGKDGKIVFSKSGQITMAEAEKALKSAR